uniref:Uncharacterized protein n=1 Tax=Aegilops tauschii subsp. strangulata TaxID=200361 RepID=A0A453RU84_AEGTS
MAPRAPGREGGGARAGEARQRGERRRRARGRRAHAHLGRAIQSHLILLPTSISTPPPLHQPLVITHLSEPAPPPTASGRRLGVVGGVVEGSRVGEWRGGAAPAAVREEEAGAHRGCLRAHAPRIWLPRHRLVLLLTHLPPPSPRSPHSPRPARWRRRGEERSRRPWPPPPHASVSSLSSLSASRDPPTRTDRERRGPGGGNRDEGGGRRRCCPPCRFSFFSGCAA